MSGGTERARKPLAGVRVIDAGTFIAAPFAAAILGEFGAEVIKIEKPLEGDPLRQFGTSGRRGDSYAWLSEQRNKKSVTLDLRRDAGKELFRKLVAKSHVLCENFRPGTLERWNLGWPVLRQDNPELILLRVSGYGQTGPLSDQPGFARTAHAFGGLTHLTGMPGGPPLTPGSTSLADYISGLYGALGVLVALRHREGGGKGQVIDVALYESVFRMLDEMVPLYAATGEVRPALGVGTANACPHGQFRCRDGDWVAIACTSDKMWVRMARLIGRRELADHPDFSTSMDRVRNRGAVDGFVNEFTGGRARCEVIKRCVEAQVPVAPVYSVADIFNDPQYAHRGSIATVPDKSGNEVLRMPGVFPVLSETPGEILSPGPPLGNANEEVFLDMLGVAPGEYHKLKAQGTI